MPATSNVIPATNPLDLIWGVDAIAAEVGLSPRQAYYALESGTLPARKIGRKWVGHRPTLRDALTPSSMKRAG